MTDDRSELFSRVCELESELCEARSEVCVIASTLLQMAERFSAPEDRNVGLSEHDVSLLYGTADLLNLVAENCEKAISGK